METNKRQHFISLFILSLLLSCSGEKKDSAQTETVSNKAIVRIETVSAQDVEQISEFTATVEANISNNIAPQNPVRIEKLFAEVGRGGRGCAARHGRPFWWPSARCGYSPAGFWPHTKRSADAHSFCPGHTPG